jgi:LCP family protein required for cell wall assembly
VAADGSNPVLVSLPRDTTDLPMPDGSVWTRKVNEIAPTLGPAVMRDAMSLLLGLQIDYYAMIDMDAFRNLVNAVGGVSVGVPYTLADKWCTIHAGTQHLDGGLALCYARHRAVDSDYARGGRHQQLMLALRDQILAQGIDVAALSGVIGSVQTDVPASDIPALIEVARSSQQAPVQRVVLEPPTYTTFVGIAGARGWISVPNVAAIRATVAALIDG